MHFRYCAPCLRPIRGINHGGSKFDIMKLIQVCSLRYSNAWQLNMLMRERQWVTTNKELDRIAYMTLSDLQFSVLSYLLPKISLLLKSFITLF